MFIDAGLGMNQLRNMNQGFYDQMLREQQAAAGQAALTQLLMGNQQHSELRREPKTNPDEHLLVLLTED